MALTVDLKPKGFRPVGGGELLYQFTENSMSGKTNYRVVVTMNDVSGSWQFRPDIDGVIRADIAPILRAQLALTTDPSERIFETYVKYQGVWDESNYSQVSLSSDIIYAYLGINHFLNSRSKFHITTADSSGATGVVLKDYSIPWSVPKGSYFVCDFLHDDTLVSTCEYELDGSGIAATSFAGNAYAMRSAIIGPITNDAGTVLTFLITENTGGDILFQKDVLVTDEVCGNPVTLWWLNDFGGLSIRVFDGAQDYRHNMGDLTRQKILTLIAFGLRKEEWEELNELMVNAPEYNDNYRLGQLVQDISDYANPVDVVVIPSNRNILTKSPRHNYSLSIRYPLIPIREI